MSWLLVWLQWRDCLQPMLVLAQNSMWLQVCCLPELSIDSVLLVDRVKVLLLEPLVYVDQLLVAVFADGQPLAYTYSSNHPIHEHEIWRAEFDAMPFVKLLLMHSRNLRAVARLTLVLGN